MKIAGVPLSAIWNPGQSVAREILLVSYWLGLGAVALAFLAQLAAGLGLMRFSPVMGLFALLVAVLTLGAGVVVVRLGFEALTALFDIRDASKGAPQD